jgi:4-aminobutyrate--pyruvate transaminase
MNNHMTNHLLHPYADLAASQFWKPLVLARGEGIFVYDDEGRQYLEGVASLWYASLGFSEPRLIEAARRQLERLPCYHAFGNKIADVSRDLADRITAMAPDHLNHVFFACSGSEANDTAVKIVRYYNNALGRPEKKKIIARTMGYHGVTLATASLTGVPRNHTDFDLPMPEVLHTDFPHFYREGRPGETEEAFADRLVASLEALIAHEGADTIAAFIAEPLMGVGGVVPPPRTYFAKVQAVLRKNDILFLVDEVISGFGRLGDMFACTTYDLRPDMLTVAKAFTAGYVPLSGLLVSDEIFDVIARRSAANGSFGHGYTYSAHPLGAAVALEALAIYEERDIVAQVRAVAPQFQEGLARFKDSPIVGDVRGRGLIAGIELVADKVTKEKFAPSLKAGGVLEACCLAGGLILRAIGDVVAISPPLIISPTEIDLLLERLGNGLRAAERQLETAA